MILRADKSRVLSQPFVKLAPALECLIKPLRCRSSDCFEPGPAGENTNGWNALGPPDEITCYKSLENFFEIRSVTSSVPPNLPGLIAWFLSRSRPRQSICPSLGFTIESQAT